MKAKYRVDQGRKVVPTYGTGEQKEFCPFTLVYVIGISSKRGRQGGNSGGVGRVARRARRWPPGLKQRRKAI